MLCIGNMACSQKEHRFGRAKSGTCCRRLTPAEGPRASLTWSIQTRLQDHYQRIHKTAAQQIAWKLLRCQGDSLRGKTVVFCARIFVRGWCCPNSTKPLLPVQDVRHSTCKQQLCYNRAVAQAAADVSSAPHLPSPQSDKYVAL